LVEARIAGLPTPKQNPLCRGRGDFVHSRRSNESAEGGAFPPIAANVDPLEEKRCRSRLERGWKVYADPSCDEIIANGEEK
jgi:hypothetical protein